MFGKSNWASQNASVSGKSIIHAEVHYDKNGNRSEYMKRTSKGVERKVYSEGGNIPDEALREKRVVSGEIDKLPESREETLGRSEKKISGKSCRESLTTSKYSCTSRRKTLELKLDMARKQAALEELKEDEERKLQKILRQQKLLDMELELQLAGGSHACSEIVDVPGNKDIQERDSFEEHQKVKDWLSEIRNYETFSGHEVDAGKVYGKKIEGEMFSKSLKSQPIYYTQNETKPFEALFARQTIKDLPLFSGDPEEWPLFISQFRRTTNSCHFTEEENLIRLQKCLRGRAREIVKPLLINSGNLNAILESLEMTFGRPDIIISLLTEKAKRMIPPSKGKADAMVNFSNAVLNLTATIEALNVNSYMNNPQLLDDLLRKLPYFLRLDWGQCAMERNNDVNLKNFSDWLKEKAKISCYVDNPSTKIEEMGKNMYQYKKKETVLSTSSSRNVNLNCLQCRRNHKLEHCQKFKELSVDDRWKLVVENKLCICCFKSGHYKSNCYKKNKCGENNCRGLHHPLLHNCKRNTQTSASTEIVNDDCNERIYQAEQSHSEGVLSTRTENCNVLLKILPVNIRGPKGITQIYAFYDDGSTISIIDADIANQLGIDGKTESLCYQWTNGIIHQEDNSKKVNLNIADPQNCSKYFRLNGVRTVKNLQLPRQSVDVVQLISQYPHVPEIKELIPCFNKQPLLLIGQDQCHLLNPRKIIELKYNGPTLTKTLLGWTVHGRSNKNSTDNDNRLLYHICDQEYEELHEIVKNSFSTEFFGVKVSEKATKTKEEERCEKIMEATTERIGFRFKTGLLWRQDDVKLPNNRLSALSRLYCMERKMDKDKEFSKQYCTKIEEYVKKGYARKLSPEEIKVGGERIWYLPHFGVINVNKQKLRLVFDAAAKTQSVSLNTELLQGPDLLRPLIGVLITFRQNKIAFTGDIKEMFHQVVIREEDRTAQRFFWRGRERKIEPEVYEMTVMTFGATCSPYLAQYIKNRNAREHEAEYSEASQAIIKKHYVDDYLDSKCSEDEAITQIRNVIEVHRRGGFEIRNFASNSRKVLQSIPEHLKSKSTKSLEEFSSYYIERVLGLQWMPESDTFIYSFNLHKINKNILNGEKIPTKRELLKFTMSIYDPLGFLGNIMISIKILLQEIWKTKIGWEDEIPRSLNEYWSSWIQSFQKVVPNIKFPRCYGKIVSLQESDYVEIHSFCDASEKAFAAAVYIHFKKGDIYETSLVASKSRVAPLKSISIPRLELQAALLASRLVNMIIEELEIKIDRKYFWTDSKTVLHWIRSDHIKYKTFVAHRVGEIRDLTNKDNWHWISTKENVADEATRLNSEIIISQKWFSGPSFLKESRVFWPKEDGINMVVPEEDREIRKLFVLTPYQTPEFLPKIERFSSYERLVRATAWVRRFLDNCKKKGGRQHKTYLEVQEIEYAEKQWFQEVQKKCYGEEIIAISRNEDISKSSKIYTLSPLLDNENLLCMKGRIYGKVYNEELKVNLIILDVAHPFTKLLIEEYHCKARHNGYEYVINELRQKFWIPKLRNAVKKIWKNCQFCKNRRAQPITPEMGLLPEARLASFQKPFTNTGLDYFGPFYVKVGRRHEKRYGAIFTCMTTRAIHIEVTWSLDTASVIMAIKRLIGRRGTVKNIYSDNGTNFHGADKELSKLIRNFEQEEIENQMTCRKIKWHFNPPYASHMGGSWERLIRSIRRNLQVILLEKYPRDEVLQTVFVEIEHIINSRPLTYVSLDPNAPESLTPNHFLIGSSKGDFPDMTNVTDLNPRKQWKVVQALSENFWKRWVKEYKPELNKQTKWFKKAESLKEDDVVLVVDNNLPRNTWPLGRIIKTYPGRDNIVRVVDVRTQYGTYRRPVTKLCKLDVRNCIE